MHVIRSCLGFVFAFLLSLLFVFSTAYGQEGDDADEEPLILDFNEARALHVPVNGKQIAIVPAFEDYAYMLFDVCDGLSLNEEDCLIYPFNGFIGATAIATIFDGNKIIVYDRMLSPEVGYEGAEMIIAHEVGHHYCGHLHKPNDPKLELEADAISGAAARLMGYNLEHALSVVPMLSERPSVTHPGRQDRINAITAGYNDPEAAKRCKD